jgi:hypothetical protein
MANRHTHSDDRCPRKHTRLSHSGSACLLCRKSTSAGLMNTQPTDAWVDRMDRQQRVPIAARTFWRQFKQFDWVEELAAMRCPSPAVCRRRGPRPSGRPPAHACISGRRWGHSRVKVERRLGSQGCLSIVAIRHPSTAAKLGDTSWRKAAAFSPSWRRLQARMPIRNRSCRARCRSGLGGHLYGWLEFRSRSP